MKFTWQTGAQIHTLMLEPRGDHWIAFIDGESLECEIVDSRPGELTLRFGERIHTFYWASDGARRWIALDGCTYTLEKPSPRARRSDSAAQNELRAPMPAQVRAVQVEPGQQVESGHTLLLLEAMKMEIRIQAPRAARVAAVHVAQGDTVERDQLLIQLEEPS
ncbi:MAG: biotin/lipoyl-binding protein [Anaerolineae bacterium]|nr:MAG: biotin/lipoyl-binding protein [Anaerolineae bacterium]